MTEVRYEAPGTSRAAYRPDTKDWATFDAERDGRATARSTELAGKAFAASDKADTSMKDTDHAAAIAAHAAAMAASRHPLSSPEHTRYINHHLAEMAKPQGARRRPEPNDANDFDEIR